MVKDMLVGAILFLTLYAGLLLFWLYNPVYQL